MALAGEQPRGRIEADPAGARQVDLAPGMQVGEVDLGARRAVERLHVGLELDQVAGHEARRQAQVAQRLHHQPAGVAARAVGAHEGLLRRLHPGLHADVVADLVLQALVQADEEVDGALLVARDAVDEGLEARRQRHLRQIGHEVARHVARVVERVLLGLGLEEEVERVVDRHLGHQVDGDLEFGGRLREHQPRQVVGEGVLLPVDEVLRRLHAQRIRHDVRTAVRRRAQAHHLWRQTDAAVVAVVRDVVQRDMDGHGFLLDSNNPDRRNFQTMMPVQSNGMASALPRLAASSTTWVVKLRTLASCSRQASQKAS